MLQSVLLSKLTAKLFAAVHSALTPSSPLIPASPWWQGAAQWLLDADVPADYARWQASCEEQRRRRAAEHERESAARKHTLAKCADSV